MMVRMVVYPSKYKVFYIPAGSKPAAPEVLPYAIDGKTVKDAWKHRSFILGKPRYDYHVCSTYTTLTQPPKE